MMTLQDYEAEVDRLSRLEIGDPEVDGYGQRVHTSDAAEACTRLVLISQRIRSIAWQVPFRPWSREVAARADTAAREIGARAGLIGPSHLPPIGSRPLP